MTTLNLGHVSIFYQVIFPVHKQGSMESPPRKQRLENDAKEREKQTIVAKNQLVGLIMQAVIGAHCKNFTGSRAYVASLIRCGADSLDGNVPMFPGTYVPRYLCSPNLCSPVPMFPGTYVPRFAVNDSTVINSTPPRLIFLSLQIDMILAVFCPGFK